MTSEEHDCLIDGLSNSDRASIVRLSSVRAKFANGARKKIYSKFFFTTLRASFSTEKYIFRHFKYTRKIW